MSRVLWCLTFLCFCTGALKADDRFFLRDGQRIEFLGDSNTFSRLYISYVDAYLFTRFPQHTFELLNLGLPSETVSGLSEPDHPYPRPCVFERLERVLTKTKPNVVVACYGMNDGIYYPFSEERFKKYQEGILRLIERVDKAGAQLVLLTPPPFDPRPLKDHVLPKSADKFSWMKPYEAYDEVLGKYAKWLLSLRDKGIVVVDAHEAIERFLASARKADASYQIAGDGIHFNALGHGLIAKELLIAWHAPAEVDQATIDAKTAKATKGDIGELSIDKGIDKGVIRFTWRTRLPTPVDQRWDRRFMENTSFQDSLNRHTLIVTGTDHDKYELFETETKLGMVSGEQLAKGVSLTTFKEASTNRRSAELWKLVDQRQELLGLAWLTAVGHKRPDTPKGKPLEEAQREADKLAVRIRELAEPASISLRLSPADK